MTSTITTAPAAKRNPRQRFDSVLEHYIRPLLRVIGCDILDVDYEPRLMVVLVVAVIVVFVVAGINALVIGTLEQKIEVISWLGICLQTPIKVYVGIVRRSEYRQIVESIRRAYRRVERSGSKELQRCEAIFSVWYVRVLNALGVLIIACGLVVISYPVIGWLVFGLKHLTVMPLMLPGLDASGGGFGYWLNQVHAVMSIVLGICGFLPSDSGFLVMVAHAYMRAIELEHGAEQLNRELREMDGVTEENVEASRARTDRMFNELIALHSEHYFYVQDVSDLYFYITTVEVYCDGLSLCSLVYVIIMLESPPAYLLFLVMFSKLLLFSMLGLVMDLANDKVYDALMSLDWYRLRSKPMRNMVVVTLMAQAAAPPKAGVVDLDLNLFASIMKTVYSIAMMLMEV